MAEDDSQPRFFAYLSLFTFAMLMLVTADNLVQMFFGWEGVGLASYLLIGFWYHKPSANAAALKAFIVNRVGDFGFSLGIFATFLVFGTVSIPAILAAAPGHGRLDDRLPRRPHRHDDPDLHPPVHRRMRQIGAARPPHLASRRDGGPDPGLRPDPRRDDGDGRRVHGLPPVADVRDQRDRACRRHLRRRRHRLLRRHGRHRPERHQAGDRLFDLLAAGLHVLRRRRRRLWRGDVPPLHPRLLQGFALPRRRLGDPRHAPRAGHALSTAALRKEIPLTFWAMLVGTLAITGVGIIQVGGLPASASPASIRRTRSSRAPSPAAPASAASPSSSASSRPC